MSSSDLTVTMYESDPMVAALNKVPGFDPLKLMGRKRIPGAEKDEKSLDFRYKKLWFRLAHRTGRIRLNRLSITEQLAIIEAQVYLELTDANPVSSFTAACTREEGGDKYIESAQIRAMDQALTDAGFGLQFVPAPVGSMENTAPQAAGPVVNMQMPKVPQPAMQQVQQATVPQPAAPQQKTAAAQTTPQSAPQQQTVSQQAVAQQKTVAAQAAPQQAVAQQRTVAAQTTPHQQAGAQQRTVAVQSAPQQQTISQQAGAQQKTVATQITPQQRTVPQRAVAQQRITVVAHGAPQQSAVRQQAVAAQATPQQRTAAQQSVVQQQTAVSQQRSVAQQAAVQPQAVRQSTASQAAVPNKPAQTAQVQAQTVQAGHKGAAIPAQAGMQTAAVSPAAPVASQKAAVPVSTLQTAAQQSVNAETLPVGQPPITTEARELPVTSDIAAAMSLLSGNKEDTLPVASAGMKEDEKAESMPQELPVAPAAATTGTSVVPTAPAMAVSGTSNTVSVSEMPAAPAPAANAGGAADEGRLYTEETSVEEILQFMTLEDAKKVVVSAGTCRGQTIAEVAQRRPFSLKFYLSEAYQGRDNVLRAAARLMLDNMKKKAG